ncbi:hypothetical protein ACFW9M_28020, partial [Streptomyces lydicus]|uniref:hypothetical protein n=1 Tax=Streptomyces lydicus TaxID=47763 RepID=UPI003679D704
MVATLGTLFLAVSPGLGTGNALVVTLLVQLGVVAVTGLLNLRLPRVVGRELSGTGRARHGSRAPIRQQARTACRG